MIIALFIAAAVDVRGPETCVDPADVLVAVDAAGGIDPAEAVGVVVDPVGDPVDPFILTVDLALIGAPPLHRVAPLRDVECKDVPELVAVLIETQRKMRSPAAAPPTAMAPPLLVPAPELRMRHRSERAAEDMSWTPCDGPPSLGGFALALGVGAGLPSGGRAEIDGGFKLSKRYSVVGVVDTIMGKSVGGYGGIEFDAPFDVVDFSIRVLAGGGYGAYGRSIAQAGQPCPPSTTSIDDKRGITTIDTRRALYASPLVGARARIGWLFVEAGGYWQVGLDPSPGIYVDVGLSLFHG